jgi:hypothetical protein
MTMLNPTLLLLLLIATASASLAHTLWGRRWLQLLIFWLAASVGCLIAHIVGLQFPLNLPSPAGVPVLEAVLAAWVCIIIASHLRV